MAFSRPKWAMDYIKEIEGGKTKDQITIVPGLIGGAKNLTYTGSGADGKTQKNMPVMEDKAQYHEGEVVVPAKDVASMGGPNSAMAKIQRLMKSRAEAPSVLGYDCGKPKIREYATGGAVITPPKIPILTNQAAPTVKPQSYVAPAGLTNDSDPAVTKNPYQSGTEEYDYWNAKNPSTPSAPSIMPLNPEGKDTSTVTVLNADGTERSASEPMQAPPALPGATDNTIKPAIAEGTTKTSAGVTFTRKDGKWVLTNMAATPEEAKPAAQTTNPYQPGTEEYDYWNSKNPQGQASKLPLNPEGGDPNTIQVKNADGTVRTAEQEATLPAQAAATTDEELGITGQSVGQTIDQQAAARKTPPPAPPVTSAPSAQTTTPAATINTGNPTYDRAANSMLQQMTAIATGTSDMVRRQYAMAFNALDSRLQTALISTAMRISNDPNLTQGAKTAMMAEQMRNAGIAQSEMAAGVAKEMISNAMNATSSAYNMANSERLNQQAMEEKDYSRKMELKTGAISAAAAAKDWKTVAAMSKELYGVDLDVSGAISDQSLATIADSNSFLASLYQPGQPVTLATPGSMIALQKIWNAQNPGKPFDEAWGRQYLADMAQTMSPSWQFKNSIDENAALAYFQGDSTKLANFTFGTKKGLEAFKDAMYSFQTGGAVALDENGQFTFNEDSPIWKLFTDTMGMGGTATGTTGTTGTTSTTGATGTAGTVTAGTTATATKPKEGDTRTNAGQTYTYQGGQWKLTSTAATPEESTGIVKPVEGATKTNAGQTFKYVNGKWVQQEAAATPEEKLPYDKFSVLGEDMQSGDYSKWKAALSGQGQFNLNDAGLTLEEFARAGNADAAKDYAALVSADPSDLDMAYSDLPQNVKDAIPATEIATMVDKVYRQAGEAVPIEYASVLLNSDPTNKTYVADFAKAYGYAPTVYSHGVYSNFDNLYKSEYSASREAFSGKFKDPTARNDAATVFEDSGNDDAGININPNTSLSTLTDSALNIVTELGELMHLSTKETTALSAAVAAEQKRRADLKAKIAGELPNKTAQTSLINYIFPTA